ncbi:hypothetical protein GCWU000342_00904 [Shuttleworthella satelles DSM 14600]|uniref:Uncharacterized protein n=1 Tax=Shuttleworthella satelles DSM 14600 TaxID=626523 RepID=C4GAF5_9FIRM|nr:hypothetical protein GCWU000342_00904 [Shuttleworthia satelles DSM 14600]
MPAEERFSPEGKEENSPAFKRPRMVRSSPEEKETKKPGELNTGRIATNFGLCIETSSA